MSRWNHAICEQCWAIRNPDRKAVQVTTAESQELCCFCGVETLSGIYVRQDPAETPCKGMHE